ncbi:transcriptional regulator, partial [Streptomyces sp. SID14478]|uniref:transcriptional regulator n=1 Tax=Streptomyces sp. SID14478 TaxID=2706073 RepID=UPI0013DCB0C0
ADGQVAQLVEGLAAYAVPGGGERPRTLRASSARDAMARGRTCYDHLAGRLGIAVADGMAERGLLRTDAGFSLTDAGLGWFRQWGAELDPAGRRPLARGCLDWTERRVHLAGVAGAALCRHAFASGWVERIGSERAVRVTGVGAGVLRAELGVRGFD